MSQKIFIYGVPGAGKTHYSKILAKELGIPVFEADNIKSILKKKISKRQSPFLYSSTCTAYKHFGDLNSENAVKGLLAVRQALANGVDEQIQSFENIVMEGAFLDPNLLLQKGKLILITTTDEKKHKKQFYKHREKLLDIFGSEFKAARLIQEYLIKEAKELGIEISEA